MSTATTPPSTSGVSAVHGPTPLDRESPLPLWAQIFADLQRRLQVGEFTTSFPGEMSLTQEYQVSRHTVREAVRRLREQGLVRGERGRASKVSPPAEIEQPLGTLYSLFASVQAAGQQQRSTVRALDVRADGVIAARLGLEESTPLLYLERIRLADGEPLAVDRVWLPARFAAPLLDADFTHTALYDELDRRCGVRLSGGNEHIRAVVPTRAEQGLLHAPDGVAAFAIERLSCAGGQPAEWRHTLVRGDRFAVSAQFSARTGYRLGIAEQPAHQVTPRHPPRPGSTR